MARYIITFYLRMNALSHDTICLLSRFAPLLPIIIFKRFPKNTMTPTHSPSLPNERSSRIGTATNLSLILEIKIISPAGICEHMTVISNDNVSAFMNCTRKENIGALILIKYARRSVVETIVPEHHFNFLKRTPCFQLAEILRHIFYGQSIGLQMCG
jgi:hypothetical protein